MKSSKVHAGVTQHIQQANLSKVKRSRLVTLSDCILYAAKVAKKYGQTYLVFPSYTSYRITPVSQTSVNSIYLTGGYAVQSNGTVWQVENSGPLSSFK